MEQVRMEQLSTEERSLLEAISLTGLTSRKGVPNRAMADETGSPRRSEAKAGGTSPVENVNLPTAADNP